MKACFFANAPFDLIERVEFYQNDIRILKYIGYDVKVANKLTNIPWDCDIYFAWWASSGAKALLISKLVRKPCIIVAGGSDVSLKDKSPAGFNQRKWFHKILIKWTLRYADAVLAVSNDVYEDAVSLGAKRIHLVYNCIDTEKYKPTKAKKEDIVLTISHLSKQNIERKGLKDIIDVIPIVLKKHPKARFVFAGKKLDGYDELRTKVKNLGVENSVEFPGSISDEEKIALYNKTKIFVSPSEHEGFGVAIAEAMACELPVIVTKRGAVPEVVGEAGLYVQLGNVDEISQSIIKLLGDGKLRTNLGKHGRERVKKFSIQERVQRIQKILKVDRR